MAICPACRKEIDAFATRCPYCTTAFDKSSAQRIIDEFVSAIESIISVPIAIIAFLYNGLMWIICKSIIITLSDDAINSIFTGYKYKKEKDSFLKEKIEELVIRIFYSIFGIVAFIVVAVFLYNDIVKNPNHSIHNKSHIETSNQNKYTSDDGAYYKYDLNYNGAILTASDHTIYIGKDCDAYSPQYGSGTWSWNSSGFYLKIGNYSFYFSNQKIDANQGGSCHS